MNAIEIVNEWRKGCTHYGPKAVADEGKERYVGGCQECTDAMVDALLRVHRESEEHVFRLRHAIVSFLDRPGCNPNQRRLQHRRLRWAADINEEPEE